MYNSSLVAKSDTPSTPGCPGWVTFTVNWPYGGW